MKYTCPCCGYKTLDEEPPGTYDICGICFWEDDGVQYRDHDYEDGANEVSLRQAQQNFIHILQQLIPEKGAFSKQGMRLFLFREE